MDKVKVAAYSVSLDGFEAGPNQDMKNPLGIGGEELHEWMYPTKMFQKMMGKEGGTEGTDNRFAERSMENIGAWIMGRNMFGPIRGPWPDGEWKGWWGDNPPYHVSVYVLTHHKREPIEMKGGTIFHFVTDGIESALEKPRKRQTAKIFALVEGHQPSVNFYKRDLSTKCIWPFRLFFSVPGNIFSPALICPSLGFPKNKKYSERMLYISF